MKIWVGVGVFRGVIDEIKVFFNEPEADAWFKETTGHNLKDFYDGGCQYYDLNGSNIFEIEIEGKQFVELVDLTAHSAGEEIRKMEAFKKKITLIPGR